MKKGIEKKSADTKSSQQQSDVNVQETVFVQDTRNSDFIQLKSLQGSANQHDQVTELESLQNQANAFAETPSFQDKTVQRQNQDSYKNRAPHTTEGTSEIPVASEQSQTVFENSHQAPLVQAQAIDTGGAEAGKPLQMMPYAASASGFENKKEVLSIDYTTIPEPSTTSTVTPTTNNDAVFQFSVGENAVNAGKMVGKGVYKLGEYAFDGFAHPLVAMYQAGKRTKEKGSLSSRSGAWNGVKEGIIGGADNPLGRGIRYPYMEAYGPIKGVVAHASQSLEATAGEVMKWSGSMAATGGLVLLAMPGNPVAASFVTATTGVTATALATKLATSGIHGAFASGYADHYYNWIEKKPEHHADDENLRKYFLVLSDAKHQNQQYGAALFQSAVFLGGGMLAENVGGSSDQLANFKETVGLSQAGTSTGEAISGIAVGTLANSQDDAENQLNLRKNINDLKDGDDFKDFNVPGIEARTTGNAPASGALNLDASLQAPNFKDRWENIKKDDRFKPPKNKSFKKSKALLLNPLYILWRALNGIVGMAELLYNTFKSDANKVEKDEFLRPAVTKEKSGKEGYGRKAGKAAATGIGGIISGGIGGALGAVGGFFKGMYRGGKKGGEKGANTFKHQVGDSMLKQKGKIAGNFILGGLGGLAGGIGGAVAGAGAGMAGGAYAGAMNVKDSVYGADASAKNFGKNALLGGVAGGAAASGAVGKASNMDDFKSKIDTNRSVDDFLSDCLSKARSMRDRLGAARDEIRGVDTP